MKSKRRIIESVFIIEKLFYHRNGKFSWGIGFFRFLGNIRNTVDRWFEILFHSSGHQSDGPARRGRMLVPPVVRLPAARHVTSRYPRGSNPCGNQPVLFFAGGRATDVYVSEAIGTSEAGILRTSQKGPRQNSKMKKRTCTGQETPARGRDFALGKSRCRPRRPGHRTVGIRPGAVQRGEPFGGTDIGPSRQFEEKKKRGAAQGKKERANTRIRIVTGVQK